METTGRGLPFAVVISFLFLTCLSPILLTQLALAQGFDVSIIESDVALKPQEPMEGDIVNITADIRNTGDTAEDVNVKFEVDGESIAWKELQPFESGIRVEAEWDTTGLDEGDHLLEITLLALGDTNSSNNMVNLTVELLPRPKPFLEIKSMTPDPAEPVEGDVLKVIAKIMNSGTADAPEATIVLKVDDVPVCNATMRFDMGTSKEVTLEWNGSVEGTHKIKVETADHSQEVPVTVLHRSEPNIFVQDIGFSDVAPTEGNQIEITAIVENQGDAGDTVTVIFKDGVKEIGRKDVSVEPGKTAKAKVKWIAKKGERVIRVEVEGYPDAVRIETIKVTNLSSRSCGGTIIVALGIVLGSLGLVGYVGKRKSGK